MADFVSTEAILSPGKLTEKVVALSAFLHHAHRPKLKEVADSHEALRAERDRHFDGLVALYRKHPAAVAKVCDEIIDPSGALLGRIRELAWAEAKVYREHDNVIPQDDGEWAGPGFDTPEATCPPHDFGQDRRWERCDICGADNPEEE